MEALTVKSLVRLLHALRKQRSINDNYEVWLSSDEEGNSFSPLLNKSEISIGIQNNKIIFYPSSCHEVTEL